jgi:hypothetical protein
MEPKLLLLFMFIGLLSLLLIICIILSLCEIYLKCHKRLSAKIQPYKEETNIEQYNTELIINPQFVEIKVNETN